MSNVIRKIRLESFDDLIAFIKSEIEEDISNMRGSVEDYEEKFGILFGTEEERSDGINNMDAVEVVDKDCLPTEYPCLMVYCNDRDFDRVGPSVVSFCIFVYRSELCT